MSWMQRKKTTLLSALLLGIVLACNAASQLFMKAAAGWSVGKTYGLAPFANVYYIAALSIYAVSFCAWQLVLRRLPLTMAHPFCALIFLIVPFFSRIFFEEQFSYSYLVGVVLICVGVAFTTLGTYETHNA